jgi:ketosteroid isomerase-like protein
MSSNLRRLAILTLLWLPGCAPAPTETDVIAALDSFWGAVKRGDATEAMTHVAPEAVFLESGRLETRAEYEKNHLPADIGFEKQVTGRRDRPRVTINGNTAWVIAMTDYEGTFEGSPISFISAQLAVLTHADGRWLIRSIHWSSQRR